MKWNLVLERRSVNRLNGDITRSRLRKIAAAAERNRGFGFAGRVGQLGEPTLVYDEGLQKEVHRYLVRLRLEKANARDAETAQRQFEHVLKVVKRCAEGQQWMVLEHAAGTDEEGEERGRKTGEERPPFVVPQLTPEVLSTQFEGIYERDEHIRIIHHAVARHVLTLAARREDPRVEVARSHLLLKGKPAGCKTTLFERFKKWYETASPGGGERVTFVDMQSATRAGLENWLLDRAEDGELADIVVLEEIEKVQPLDNLLPLVSLMGSGYVAKLNARVGYRRQLADVLVLATCNDEHLIRRWRGGALWSRFAHKLHCARPSRELMRRILLDTVERAGGNPAWADAAMKFAFEQMPLAVGYSLDDPREIKGLLDGQDRLLDGSYQQDLLTILESAKAEARFDRRNARTAASRGEA